MTAEYPLQWPTQMPRSARREKGLFKTTLQGALKNVKDSLRRFSTDSGKALENVVISSNVTLGNEKPADPGVSVWFVWDGMQICIPVDRYDSVAANLQAIHHVMEARRTELRHGTLALVRATFHGFQALPAPAGRPVKRPWWEVLGVNQNCTRQEAIAAFQKLAKERHPDVSGGSVEKMSELNVARDEAKVHFGK